MGSGSQLRRLIRGQTEQQWKHPQVLLPGRTALDQTGAAAKGKIGFFAENKYPGPQPVVRGPLSGPRLEGPPPHLPRGLAKNNKKKESPLTKRRGSRNKRLWGFRARWPALSRRRSPPPGLDFGQKLAPPTKSPPAFLMKKRKPRDCPVFGAKKI